MPEAKLTLTLPELTWPGAVTRAHPEARVTVLAVMVEEDSGVGLVEIVAPNVNAVKQSIREHDSISSVTVLQRTAGKCLLQFRTEQPLLLFAAKESGLPLEFPLEIQEGRTTIEVTAARESISTLGDQLSAMGIDYSVEYLQEEVSTEEPLLTDRQRQLLTEAIRCGYYDTPRRCSLTELADAVGLAKSTTSETLHRAEERVMKEFASSVLGLEEATDPTATTD